MASTLRSYTLWTQFTSQEHQNNPLKRQSLLMGKISQNETLEFPDFMKLSGTRIALNLPIFNIH